MDHLFLLSSTGEEIWVHVLQILGGSSSYVPFVVSYAVMVFFKGPKNYHFAETFSASSGNIQHIYGLNTIKEFTTT
ncbi:unnamed protein product [Brassica rapa]|uniref:Uncharacterized protein n=2 Tax=Brassica TaxID=3705 RepID=A0A8D9HPL7_BRACM|nr:unnamed protein product [Brassica napus]CAG7901384.1 unnamed protein product [Brassica rapa]